MRICLLGGFRVSIGETSIPPERFRLRKARSLVKILALDPRHQSHREALMEQLWPEFEPRRAAGNLAQAVFAARRALGTENGDSPFLTYQDEILCLGDPACVWVDVDAFEIAAAQARREKEASACQAALDLYTGDLLPEDCYEAWCAPRRERLRQARLELLHGLAEAHSERGEYPAAILALQQVLSSEPEREEAHVGLMRLYALSGQRQAALRQYQALQEALGRELGVEPQAGSLELYQTILSGRFPAPGAQSQAIASGQAGTFPPARRPNHNLPARLNSFVGRQPEIERVQRYLESSRLVTLTGAGGVGKSSLALQCAAGALEEFPHGAWLVELAPVSDPQLVAQAIAEVLQIQPGSGGSYLAALQAYLGSRQVLIVLDNCEHLIQACAALVEALLKSCPGVRVLATSRERLAIAGEQVFAVPALAFPAEHDHLAPAEYPAYAAVQLFLDRARAVLPGYTLDDSNAPAVAQICRRLDGLPLALELAAARLPLLSAGQIAERLDDAFHLLTGGERTALPRQQTLRATLDWSYQLLAEPERRVLRRLSVFAGGWTLAAAEAVCSMRPDDRTALPSILDLLDSLVHKSLVLAERQPGSERRYRLLETVRQYSQQKLDESGERQSVRRRHLAYYLRLGQPEEPESYGTAWLVRLARLRPEWENIRAALSWSLDETPQENAVPGLRLAEVFLTGGVRDERFASWYPWLEYPGWARKGLAYLDGCDERDSLIKAKTLVWLGRILFNSAGFEMMEAGLALYRQNPLTDPRDLAWALRYISLVSIMFKGDPKQARKHSMESVMILRALAPVDRRELAASLYLDSYAAVLDENYPDALALGKESYDLYLQAGDPIFAVIAQNVLAYATYSLDDIAAARSHLETGLRTLQEADPLYREFMLDEMQKLEICLADIDYVSGNYAAARQRYVDILAFYRERGVKIHIGKLIARLGLIDYALGDSTLAIANLRAGLQAAVGAGWWEDTATVLTFVVEYLRKSDRVLDAARLLGALQTISNAIFPYYRKEYRISLKAVQAALSAESFDAAFAGGRALTLDQAAAFAEQMLS